VEARTEVYIFDKEQEGNLGFRLSHDEFKCKCDNKRCNFTLINRKLLTRWYALRKAVDSTLNVNSGYRCQSHNDEVGGTDKSYHQTGSAVDISYKHHGEEFRKTIIAEAKNYFDYVKDYPDQEFVHCHVLPTE